MKVLGIDPGTRVVGYAVVEMVKGAFRPPAYGAICAKVSDAVPERLKYIYAQIMEVIALHRPEVMSLEKVFYGKNIQSAIRIGEARGVAMLAAANSGLAIYEYDATKVKKAVVGTGSAHKSQIQHMVKAIFGLAELPSPADAADALAIAVCHCHQNIGLGEQLYGSKLRNG